MRDVITDSVLEAEQLGKLPDRRHRLSRLEPVSSRCHWQQAGASRDVDSSAWARASTDDSQWRHQPTVAVLTPSGSSTYHQRRQWRQSEQHSRLRHTGRRSVRLSVCLSWF